MIKRTDKLNQIKSCFDRSPIVSITGLRQSGKTILAKEFASQYQGNKEDGTKSMPIKKKTITGAELAEEFKKIKISSQRKMAKIG